MHYLRPCKHTKSSTEIVTAVLNMFKPHDKSVERGHHYFSFKFYPHLSEVVPPFCDLINIKQEEKDFLWAGQHSEAFIQARTVSCSGPRSYSEYTTNRNEQSE